MGDVKNSSTSITFPADFHEALNDVETSETNVGAIIKLDGPKEGDINWKASQVKLGRSLPPGAPKGRKGFKWLFGPLEASGYIDTDSYGLGVEVSILGIELGNIYGNLKEGVGLDVDLFLVSGSIMFHLLHSNQLWCKVRLSVKFDGSWDEDVYIVSF
ncbi:hypothetical protein PRZ48_001769 [Zasmidium cellare]|uniref:Uncharacterized protein n=1 Tax=Zasmidium cellare TaxID=395010 RepID=A0ABR0F423_ZASCE|nr:hypothetical protein PRZ48_001769 [Zasmidium cellare]